MLQTKIRPLTATERERLEAELLEATTDPKPDRGGAFFFGMIGMFFGFVAGVLSAILSAKGEPDAVRVAVISCTGAVAGFVIGWRTASDVPAWQVQSNKERAALIATRLGRGNIEEITVTAMAVAPVSDGDDSGGYFFDIGDKRILFLWDYDLWDWDRNGEPQPVSAFTLTRFPDAPGDIWDYVAFGEPLEPVRELAFMVGDVIGTYQSGAVFDATLATIETDLPHLAVAPND